MFKGCWSLQNGFCSPQNEGFKVEVASFAASSMLEFVTVAFLCRYKSLSSGKARHFKD